jgi:UDP-N-acetylmuramoyl-tripeptide--D-alanyl-D-alanine ligase
VGGSNGKTTTKEMLVALLGGSREGLVATRKSENGFVGIPKTLCGAAMRRGVTEVVLEVGIDEPGSMAQHIAIAPPDVALLTSLSHEHLQGLGSLEKVIDEEMVLMDGPWVRVWQCSDGLIAAAARKQLRQGDWVVMPNEMDFALPMGVHAVEYTTMVAADLSQTVSLSVAACSAGTTFFAKADLNLALPGRHNAANAALAFAAAWALRGPAANETPADFAVSLARSFKNFAPPELRSHLELFTDGSALLVDCYNSNPASLRASLESVLSPAFQGHTKILFLGDMLDLGDQSAALHDDLISDLESMPNCQLYLYGEAMYAVFSKLQNIGGNGTLGHLHRAEDPAQWIAALPRRQGPVFVLVKGSRGMAMERLVPGLRKHMQQC